MPRTFSCDIRVRTYECDMLGHVNNAVYQQYLEEAAIQATSDAGFDLDWYRERSEAWVVRKMSIEYVRPARAGDVLTVTTWISSKTRVRAQRKYQVRLRSDGQDVARATADWVYVDLRTGRPKAIPPEFGPAFEPGGQSALGPARLPERGMIEAAPFHWRHHVARYELDTNQHVNNAVYLNWVEEAKFRACDDAEWPVERMLTENLVIVQIRHDTEYFAPAVRRDEIEVVSRLYEVRHVRGTWIHDVLRVGTGDRLARNYSAGAFLDRAGRPIRPPQQVLSALLKGQPSPDATGRISDGGPPAPFGPDR